MPASHDRRRQDVGNILVLEHVNVRVPDQRLATLFYVEGLGFTRDPYLMVGTENMWINLGQHQFHLPTGEPQVLRGHVGLVVPDLEALAARLAAVQASLAGTAFAFRVDGEHVAVTSPWGNALRCHAPGPRWGATTLGMAYVEFPVAPGHAGGVARFYQTVLGAPAAVVPEASGVAARVTVGASQELVFRETPVRQVAYDGHHIAIYLADFSGPHRRLGELGLLTQDTAEHEYRFERIVDPETRVLLFEVEHEVRSFGHPMFLRPLVNRNPAQRQATYARGRDAFTPAG